MEGVCPNVASPSSCSTSTNTSTSTSTSTTTTTTTTSTTTDSSFLQLAAGHRHDTLSPQSTGATAEETRQLMRRERRTLSVPVVTYQDESSGGMTDSNGFLATSPQQGGGAGWPPLQHHHQQQQHSLGRPLFNRSRSASTSALSTTASAPPGVKKKIVVACLRCRTRKIRCDGHLPACKSCVKAGTDCIEVDRSGDNNTPRSHVLELENRIRWLEDIIRDRASDVDLQSGPPAELRSRPPPPVIRIVTAGHDFHPQPSPMSNTSSPVFALSPASTCATPSSFDFSPVVSPAYLAPVSPYTFSDGPSPSPSPAPSSPMLSPFFQPQELAAHDVGLLSLSAFEEPKYVGSSSGVSFAKLAFQDTFSTEFRAVDYGGCDAKPNMHWPALESEPMALPTLDQCVTLSSAYFSTVALQYPFLHRHTFDACLEATFHAEKGDMYQLPQGYSLPVARFHVFMVLSIGAGVLSAGSGEIESEGFSARALRMINEISITGSIPGVQSALLLAMRSLHSSEALNIWYLNALIMATCVDLGLHRKPQSQHTQLQSGLKRRIFWSAYALDRTLGIALGRPFSLRDESIDVDFPDECDNDEEEMLGASLSHLVAARASFSTSVCLFKIVKVLSGIKTTIYCTAQTARWQGDPLEWQMAALRRLNEIHEQAQLSNPTAALLVDLKFHESVQLLFRPSPTFPHPSPTALQHCFTSSVESIRILSKLSHFGQLPHSWMTAYSLFLSGAQMLHAHRNSRDPQALATADALSEDIQTCSCLLAEFAERHPAAARWRSNFDRLTTDTVVHSTGSRMLSPNDVRAATTAGQTEWFEGMSGDASGLDINMCCGLPW